MELNSWLAFLGIQASMFVGFAILHVYMKRGFDEMSRRMDANFAEMRRLTTAVAGMVVQETGKIRELLVRSG